MTTNNVRRDRLDLAGDRTTSRSQPARQGLDLAGRIDAMRSRLESRADPREAATLRADVREARVHVRDWTPGKVTHDTATRYARTVETMRETGTRPEDSACRATFEFRRAAVVHEARRETKQALSDLDRARRRGDAGQAADAYTRVRQGLDTLRQYPPSSGNRSEDLKRTSAYTGSRDPVDGSYSKRASLDRLPFGWRDDVQREAVPADRPAVAAMSLTGCRPAEVRGIRVTQDSDSVTFSIRGAKVDDARGVESREITLSKSDLATSQAGRDLAEWLGSRSVRTITHSGGADNFAERTGRACERAGHPAASAYSFRHQTARDLRLAGADHEAIAARLGHRSDRSQRDYG